MNALLGIVVRTICTATTIRVVVIHQKHAKELGVINVVFVFLDLAIASPHVVASLPTAEGMRDAYQRQHVQHVMGKCFCAQSQMYIVLQLLVVLIILKPAVTHRWGKVSTLVPVTAV